ncbi:flagellar biosynthesis anti-sigma factor FlgM [Rhizorhabdus argentea]|uniref:flagellar biosynthesis anti-sigma factor FlgM n=1 Tax=Rhizorhabdus argentea TaxID=1387174 RepID=UPI0030ED9081
MINGVGPTSPIRIGQVKDDKIAAPAATESAPAATGAAATPSLVAALTEAGPPIDADKIRAIREAIAAGKYPIDAKAIAAKMIALDLPQETM